jgi:hypothetical protein
MVQFRATKMRYYAKRVRNRAKVIWLRVSDGLTGQYNRLSLQPRALLHGSG